LKTTLASVIRALGFALVVVVTANLQAGTDKPLVMEGKKTLYQRVLSVPDARLYESPDRASESSE